jgi:hypothetical protein
LAASLALPALDTEAAAGIAEAEGLVTHLTSLVLTDEQGSVQEGIPATRHIAPPTPASHGSHWAGAAPPESRGLFDFRGVTTGQPLSNSSQVLRGSQEIRRTFRRAASAVEPLDWPTEIARKIGWGHAPVALLAGDLSILDVDTAMSVRGAAATPKIVALADRLGLDPIVVVIGLAAFLAAARNRSAARVASGIFRRIKPEILSRQDPGTGKSIREEAGTTEVVALAARVGMDPIVVTIGLAAFLAAADGLSGARGATADLLRGDVDLFNAALRTLGRADVRSE